MEVFKYFINIKMPKYNSRRGLLYGTKWRRRGFCVNFKYSLAVEFFKAFRNTLDIIIAVLLISSCIGMHIKCSRSPAFYIKTLNLIYFSRSTVLIFLFNVKNPYSVSR